MKATPARSRSAPFAIAAAFAAGIASAGVMWWWVSRDREPAQGATAPAATASAARQVPLVEAPAVIINKPEKTPAAPPNPFQRLPAGTPLAAASRPYAARALAQPRATEQETGPHTPIVTWAWVQKLRASCAQRAGKEKAECERLADVLERIVADPDRVDRAWERDMQAALLELFDTSARSADFSLHEVTCNANACVLYWHSSDYADWRGAGSALLADLMQGSRFREFDLRALHRVGDFDPITSTPWEMIVLERNFVTGEQAQ